MSSKTIRRKAKYEAPRLVPRPKMMAPIEITYPKSEPRLIPKQPLEIIHSSNYRDPEGYPMVHDWLPDPVFYASQPIREINTRTWDHISDAEIERSGRRDFGRGRIGAHDKTPKTYFNIHETGPMAMQRRGGRSGRRSASRSKGSSRRSASHKRSGRRSAPKKSTSRKGSSRRSASHKRSASRSKGSSRRSASRKRSASRSSRRSSHSRPKRAKKTAPSKRLTEFRRREQATIGYHTVGSHKRRSAPRRSRSVSPIHSASQSRGIHGRDALLARPDQTWIRLADEKKKTDRARIARIARKK